MVEERIADLYPEQQMRCPVHLCIGQEAIAVGVCAALERDDSIMSGHRSHGHYLAKGGDLKRMLAEIYGKATGCSGGKGGSMHLVDTDAGFLGAVPIVGSTIPIAVGVAFGATLRGESKVSVVFFGEGATEEGVFAESLNFSALKQLPVIFICENNLYSVYSHIRVRQAPTRSICNIAKSHGMDASSADGNDVEAVLALASKAVSRARDGSGPTLLEFSTYRWREHCGPNYDNNLGYRMEAEFQEWQKRCPIRRIEERLVGRGGFDVGVLAELRKELAAEIEDAVAFAKESPFPEPREMMRNVYED